MAPETLVGTSGYAYSTWRGPFYPKKLKSSAFLPYYARHFSAVEINNTFYRMPRSETLVRWAEQVPAAFRFVLKAPMQITHRARLRDSAAEPLAHFCRVVKTLGKQAGPLFFQLPPNLKKDLPRLEAFLKMLPARTSAAIEFRHPSWFDEAVYALLRRRRVALCIADTDEARATRIATAGFGYLRLRRTVYTKADLARWHAWVQQQAWKKAWIFFKHEEKGRGPRFAQGFAELG